MVIFLSESYIAHGLIRLLNLNLALLSASHDRSTVYSVAVTGYDALMVASKNVTANRINGNRNNILNV